MIYMIFLAIIPSNVKSCDYNKKASTLQFDRNGKKGKIL